jgi:hypothetical protein
MPLNVEQIIKQKPLHILHIPQKIDVERKNGKSKEKLHFPLSDLDFKSSMKERV